MGQHNTKIHTYIYHTKATLLIATFLPTKVSHNGVICKDKLMFIEEMINLLHRILG